MAYTDFNFETIDEELGITCRPGMVFHDLKPLAVPAWLTEALKQGFELALVSDKARSEFITAPTLMAVRAASEESITIVSGECLDVDSSKNLMGECDFLLTRSEPVPIIRAPILVVVVQAKHQDIVAGLGPCIAQMVAAQIFNERKQKPVESIYGCVTTGETWQFLQLTGTTVTLHQPRIYIDNVGLLLAAFVEAVRE